MSVSTPSAFSSSQIFKDGWFQFFIFLAVAGGIGLIGSAPLNPPKPVPRPNSQPDIPTTRELQNLPEKAAPKTTAKNPGKWIVDTTGASDSDTKTINEALAYAQPGESIYVRPGVYKENLVLMHDIHLIASGAPGSEVRIASDTLPVIRSENAAVSMDGIEVLFAGTKISGSVIQVNGGKWNFARAHIISTQGDLISAQRASAEFEDVKLSRVADSHLDGIVLENSTFSCKLCQFTEIAIHQNSQQEGQTVTSSLTITASTFEGTSSKILVGGHSEAKISSTEFKGTNQTAILCSENSNCDLQDLKFIENVGSAISGTDWAKIHIQDGYALKNIGPAIFLSGKSELHASNFRIEESSGDGISVRDDATLDLTNVKFDSLKSNGIAASGRSQVSAKSCEFNKISKMGIFLTDDAKVVEDQQNHFIETQWGTITKKGTS